MARRKKEESVVVRARDYAVLSSPVITEKSSVVGADGTTVVFRVDRRATKDDIRAAVERVYKVKVSSVRTLNMLGKPKGNARTIGRRAAYKKAYVALAKGNTINVVEGL